MLRALASIGIERRELGKYVKSLADVSSLVREACTGQRAVQWETVTRIVRPVISSEITKQASQNPTCGDLRRLEGPSETGKGLSVLAWLMDEARLDCY